jgi:hypothetical protein
MFRLDRRRALCHGLLLSLVAFDRWRVSRWVLTPVAQMHSSGSSRWVGDEVEQFALIRAGPRVSVRLWGCRRRGSIEVIDVALQFGPGQSAAASDVDCVQVAALHQRVHRGAADAEDFGGFLGGEQERLVGEDVSWPL